MSIFDFPIHLSFDPNMNCNLQCQFCYIHHPNSKWVSGEYPTRIMPLELMDKMLQQTQGHEMLSIRPYLNGEPLCEPRMPKIVSLIKQYNDAPIVFYSNGTVYANREFLMLGIGEVHFTVSAATPETYLKVHGRPLYHEGVKTIEWLEQQPNHPKIFLKFVITQDNIHELPLWMQQWRRFPQERNLAHGYNECDSESHFLKAIQIPDESIVSEDNVIGCNPWLPCSFYDNAIITSDGDFRLCCLSGISFGNIKDEPLETLWRRRCQNKGENPDCRRCVFKGRNWDGWMKLIN